MALADPPPMHLLFLLNPGRQSRHYILGLVHAALRLQIPHTTLELDQVWQRVQSAPDKPAAIRDIQTQIARLVKTKSITHALGYVHNGVFDFGTVKDHEGKPRSLLTALGVRHILLWTDHPEWSADGLALKPPILDLLRDDRMHHILKSTSAAAEATAILNWPNISALPMAEDYEALPPIPAAARNPTHDIILIRGDAAPIPPILQPYLDHSDPDPAELDHLLRPAALDKFASHFPDHLDLARQWLDAKIAAPDRSFFSSLLTPLSSLPSALRSPTPYYTALASLRIALHWRRNFWPAWLARRVNVGSYGSPAHDPAFNQSPEQAQWVAYDQQPAIYARGQIALNINAAHDEEGLTHKPFQIAASHLPCIHHHTRDLESCFPSLPSFRRGPELLNHVRTLLENPQLRAQLADQIRTQALTHHTWDHRLTQILARIPR